MEEAKYVSRILLPMLMHYRVSSEHVCSGSGARDATAQLVEQFAYEYGETYDAYLATESDREYFVDSAERGAVAYHRRGRHLIVGGSLLAPPEACDSLLAEFIAHAHERQLQVSFVNVPRSQTKLFRRHGLQITKWGEEPIICLQETTWQGKEFGWVRRQENFCSRQGATFEEVVPDVDDPTYRDRIVPELLAVSDAHIGATLHRRELPVFEGRFCPLHMQRRRLFVARRAGRIEAFVVCNPGMGGDFWAIEIYRRLPDAVRGVIPFLIMKILRRLKEEGACYASLSLVPFVRCETAVRGDSGCLRVGANFWWKHLNVIFDMQGIYHFKSRFRPHYRELYVAAKPGLTLRSSISLALAWKVLSFNPLRLLRRMLFQWGARRRTLAKPDWRPERLIHKLRPADAPHANAAGSAAEAETANDAMLLAE